MNKEVYLYDLEYNKINNDCGDVKATIVFKDPMKYEEFKKIKNKIYFYLSNNNQKNSIIEMYKNIIGMLMINENLNIGLYRMLDIPKKSIDKLVNCIHKETMKQLKKMFEEEDNE